MYTNRIVLTLLLSLSIWLIRAQAVPFEVALEPLNINGLGGIQSYAWGQHNGKWLIVGGRLDGLHRRQPFAAFDLAGHNTQLIVVDPVNQQKWTAPLSGLPAAMQEQFRSTNMEFHQEGDYLYLLGGYGYSNLQQNHITFPNLSAIKVPDVINAVINASPFAAYCRQISDTLFAVTGGVLNTINHTYYLSGGHKFTGLYNPQGPNMGPGFVQIYTNAIRRFKLSDNGTTITITHLSPMMDPLHFHRRDYNVVPQIFPNAEEGITIFSGVFQPTVNLPYLNAVNIDSTGYAIDPTFAQYYNHYHCARIPLYSATSNQMHNLFFGGIAQYYDNAGTLVQDNNVPFVKTIARVTRNALGAMSEHKLPIEMPALLGAGSEFIPVEGLPVYVNGVFDLDQFTADSTLVGYIYGGISSTAANVFFSNASTPSSASSQIFKVYIIKSQNTSLDQLNVQSVSSLHMLIAPQPNGGDFFLGFSLSKASKVTVRILNEQGQLLESQELQGLQAGEQRLEIKLKKALSTGVYLVQLITPYEQSTQKLVISR